MVEPENWRWDRFWLRKHSIPGDPVNTKPNPFLEVIVKDRRPGTVLDVGMGSGRNAIFLAQQGWDVSGLDISRMAIKSAQERAKESGLRLNAIHQEMRRFDFGANLWDLILFMYLPVPEPEVIRRIHTSLKPGGLLVLEHYHRDCEDSEHVKGLELGALLGLLSEFNILRCERVVVRPDWDEKDAPMVRLVAEKSPSMAKD